VHDLIEMVGAYAKELNITPEEYIRRAVEEKIKLGKKTSFPDDFMISSNMQQWFKDQRFDFDIQEATDDWAHSMVNNRSKYKYANWEAAWRNGMKKHKLWRAKGGRIERSKTAYEEFSERPRSAIEKAVRLRQGRETSGSARGCSKRNRQAMGQNGSNKGPSLDNAMGRH